jgi:hypothetical protein
MNKAHDRQIKYIRELLEFAAEQNAETRRLLKEGREEHNKDMKAARRLLKSEAKEHLS